MTTTAPLAVKQVRDHPDTLSWINVSLLKELIGFALRKSDPDTLNCFNNWIRNVENEGWLEERHNYWFETLDWESEVK